MSKVQAQQIIDSVRDAVEKECWIPALCTALTIPDILGHAENPEERVGDRYRAWFQEHVEHRYADESGFDENWHAKNPYFTAKMCYDLRCKMLHQGSDDIDFEYRFEDNENADYSYSFELRANACDSYGAIWMAPQKNAKLHKVIHVCVDIKTLCDALCDEGEAFLDSMPDELFESVGFSFVDLSRILNHFDK